MEAEFLWLASPESPGAISSEPDVVGDFDVRLRVEDVAPDFRLGRLPNGVNLKEAVIVGAVGIAPNDVRLQPALAVSDSPGLFTIPLPSRVTDQLLDLH